MADQARQNTRPAVVGSGGSNTITLDPRVVTPQNVDRYIVQLQDLYKKGKITKKDMDKFNGWYNALMKSRFDDSVAKNGAAPNLAPPLWQQRLESNMDFGNLSFLTDPKILLVGAAVIAILIMKK